MTLSEFSNEFDILYNNIMSNMAAGLDEYDKSVFLTQAQEELIIGFYTGKNADGTTFEETEESKEFLAQLVNSYQLTNFFTTNGVKAKYLGTPQGCTTQVLITANNVGIVGNFTLVADNTKSINTLISDYNTAHPSNLITLTTGNGTQVPTASITLSGGIDNTLIPVSNKSRFITIPSDVWFLVYESATLVNNTEGDGYAVLPYGSPKDVNVKSITHDNFTKKSANPFKRDSINKVLKLTLSNHLVEFISDYKISKYVIRYVKQPKPIILADISDGTIGGLNVPTACELHPSLHQIILKRAVDTAVKVYNFQNK